jgi:hypothetical protein
MRLPRFALLAIWAALTASAYALILFTNWGNAFHGGSPLGVLVTDAVIVLAVLACVEVIRSERGIVYRALAGAVGVPLVLVTLLTLWYGVQRYLAA